MVNRLFKKLCIAGCVVTAAAFVLIGCKREPAPQIQSADAELKLTSMTIHGESVINGAVKVKADSITADDITAKFNYGTLKNQTIKVTVKGTVFTVDKNKKTVLYLSVPPVKNEYRAWNCSVEVSYNNGGQTPQPSGPADTDLISKFNLNGDKIGGEEVFVSKTVLDEIMAGKNIIAEMKGTKAVMHLASQKITWTLLKVNGKNITAGVSPFGVFKSYATVLLELPEKENILNVHAEVEGSGKRTEIAFRIKRIEGTVDMPHLKLLIGGKDVIGMGTLKKLADGSKPSFKGTEPASIEVQSAADDLQSVEIDSVNAAVSQKQENGQTIWFAQRQLTGINPNGKEVTVKLIPKNSADYHEVTWVFKLEYQPAIPMNVIYTINNKPRRLLDSTFVEQLENGGSPSLNIQGSFLNISLDCKAKLSEIVINGTSFTGTALTETAIGTKFDHSVKIDTAGTPIKIVMKPKDSAKYAEKVFTFKAIGDGTKENVKAEIAIGRNLDLPETFLNGLTDNSKPLYKVVKSPAEIEVFAEAYTFNFLCNKIRINNEEIALEKKQQGYKTFYSAVKSIEVTESEAKEIKIEFIPKNAEMTAPLVWNFKLQSGAEIPPIPQNKITRFFINGKGGFGNNLPEAFTAHLTDGTNPVYEIDAASAEVEVGWRSDTNDIIEKAVFTIDGGAGTDVTAVPAGASTYAAKHTFTLSGTDVHSVTIDIIPKAGENYKKLTYSFKLKNSGQKPEMIITFGFDDMPYEDGTEKTLNKDFAIIYAETDEDIMDTVTIDGNLCTVEKVKDQLGFVFKAMHAVELTSDSLKTVSISVTPKDTSAYRTTECSFKLKGTPSPVDNAEFEHYQHGSEEVPKVLPDIEWVDDEEREAPEDHGAKAVTLTAYTVSPHTKVMYKQIYLNFDTDPDGVETELTPEQTMTRMGNMHTSAKIMLTADKPTTVKAWVVADNGTTNTEKGEWSFTYNPADLKWDYQTHAEGENFANSAYDIIKIDKSKVSGNKIFLSFSVWKEEFGCVVKNNSLTFKKLNTENDLQWYTATVDVSSLTDPSKEISLEIPLLFNGKPSFTYRFKIKSKT